MSARDAIILDEATHTYTVGGRVVPGVTRILEPLCSWDHVDPDVLDRKSALGRAVHAATEFDDKGTLDEASVSEEVAGYLEGWRRFRREMQPCIVHCERKVHHPSLGFCGTLDRELQLPAESDTFIADIKSGVKHRVHGVQIAGYSLARMAEEGWTRYPRRVGVYLTPDGRYELVRYTNPADYSTFVSALNIYNWRNA